MDGLRVPGHDKAYRARLRGGPDDGSELTVTAMSDGEPPEFIHPGADDSGMYLLAGLPNPDGSTPYWWVAADRGAASFADPGEATWTLISIGDDGTITTWHQHGEDAEPVPLVAEHVEATGQPTHVGHAYNCPTCHDRTVISRPVQPTVGEPTIPIEASKHVN